MSTPSLLKVMRLNKTMVGSLVALCLVYYMLAIACVIVKGRHYLIRHASPQPRHRLCVPFEASRFRTELKMKDRHGGGQETTLGLAMDAHLYHSFCNQLSQRLGVASYLEPCQTPPPSSARASTGDSTTTPCGVTGVLCCLLDSSPTPAICSTRGVRIGTGHLMCRRRELRVVSPLSTLPPAAQVLAGDRTTVKLPLQDSCSRYCVVPTCVRCWVC